MKFELDQLVYYIENNKVHSAKVIARMKVENLHPDWNSTKAQREAFTPFGSEGVFYSTCHNIYPENLLFASREELAQSLL